MRARSEALASCKDKEKGGKKIEVCWFKRIDHGEALGKIIFEHWNQIETDKRIKKMFEDLSEWVSLNQVKATRLEASRKPYTFPIRRHQRSEPYPAHDGTAPFHSDPE